MICMFQVKYYCQAGVFENFGIICLKMYRLDSAKFLSDPGLAWQAALRKTKVK